MQARCNVEVVGSVCDEWRERSLWERLDSGERVRDLDNSKILPIVVLSTGGWELGWEWSETADCWNIGIEGAQSHVTLQVACFCLLCVSNVSHVHVCEIF